MVVGSKVEHYTIELNQLITIGAKPNEVTWRSEIPSACRAAKEVFGWPAVRRTRRSLWLSYGTDRFV